MGGNKHLKRFQNPHASESSLWKDDGGSGLEPRNEEAGDSKA